MCAEYQDGFSRQMTCENSNWISLAQGFVKTAMLPSSSAEANLLHHGAKTMF
jgi:hypothetical protein